MSDEMTPIEIATPTPEASLQNKFSPWIWVLVAIVALLALCACCVVSTLVLLMFVGLSV